MEGPKRSVEWLIWGGLALTIVVISAAFVLERVAQSRGAGNDDLPVISQVPEVTLTNQNGQAVAMSDLRGKVWIGDIIFTRCAGPCPVMTRRMSKLQGKLPAKAPVRLVTLTTDPDFDTPAIMKRYGERFGANFQRWLFLTGSKAQIRQVAVDGLKLVATEKPAGQQSSDTDLFIHSTIFVIVDQQGRLRGALDSTEAGFESKALRAVRRLLREKQT